MKTLKLLLLLLAPAIASAQSIQYLGTNNNIVEVRNAFNLPKDSVGVGNIRLKDTTLQYKVGSNWRVVGSGSGTSVDSSNFQKISNKVTTLTNSTTQYPSTSAIRDSIYTKSFTYTKSQTDSAIAAGASLVGLSAVTDIDSSTDNKLTLARGLNAGVDTNFYDANDLIYNIGGSGSFVNTERRRNFARPVQMSIVNNAAPTSPPAIFVDYHGLDISGNGGRTTNSNTRLYPFESTARFNSDTANELGKMVGGYLQNTNIGLGKVISSVNLRLRFSNTGGGNVTEAIGAHFESPINTGGSTVDNYYAIKIDPVAAATNNWGIFSNTYNNYFAAAEVGFTGLSIRGQSSGSSLLLAQVAGTDVTHRMPVNSGTLALASEVLTKASPVWTSRATGELMTISRTETATTTPTLAPLNVDITGSPSSAPAGSLDLKSQEIIHRTTGSNTTSLTRSFPLRVVSTNNATSVLGRQISVTGQTNNTGAGTVNQSIVFDATATHSGTGSMLDLRAFNVNIPTRTAGSIRKATGFYFPALNNADTVFAIYSEAASGGNKWFAYHRGNAPSYMSGRLSLGAVDTTKQLTVTGGVKLNAATDSINISTNGQYASLRTNNLTANRAYQFPDSSGTLVLASGLNIYPQKLTATQSIDFPSIPANSEGTGVAVTVTGALTTDNVIVNVVNTTGVIYKSEVTAPNTVTIYPLNITANAIDPASAPFRVMVLR